MPLPPQALRRTAAASVAALLGGLLAGEASTQTCASPLLLTGTPGPHYFNTCQMPNSLPILGGFFPSPHNDAVVMFVVSPGMSGTIWVSADFAAAVMLMQSPCGPETPLAHAAMAPALIALGDLPAGNQFLVLTGDPKVPSPTCGVAAVTASVVYSDVIFDNGFQ